MTRQSTILVVEDQAAERRAMASLLETENYAVLTARGRRDAEQLLGDHVDLVICDLRLGQASGVEVLRAWREKWPDAPFVMVTAFGDVDSAVSAMKLGADDFLTKPIHPETLLETIRTLLATRAATATASADAASTATALPANGKRLKRFGRMLAAAESMHELFRMAERAAASAATVLILGESGVGKELLADAIH